MGNSNGSREYFHWEDQFRIIQKQNANVLLLQRIGTKQKHLGRQIIVSTEPDKEEVERLLDAKSKNPSPYLNRMERFQINKNQSYCSSDEKYHILFENPGIPLNEQVVNRRLSGQQFSQEQIFQLIQNGAFALRYLQDIDHAHQNICPSSFFMAEKGQIILGDPWITAPEIDVHKGASAHNYPSYEKLEYHEQAIQYYDPFVSDLFSLGCVALELMYDQNMDVIYGRNVNSINANLLDEKIQGLNNDDLRHILKLLCSRIPQQRVATYNILDQRKKSYFLMREEQEKPEQAHDNPQNHQIQHQYQQQFSQQLQSQKQFPHQNSQPHQQQYQQRYQQHQSYRQTSHQRQFSGGFTQQNTTIQKPVTFQNTSHQQQNKSASERKQTHSTSYQQQNHSTFHRKQTHMSSHQQQTHSTLHRQQTHSDTKEKTTHNPPHPSYNIVLGGQTHHQSVANPSLRQYNKNTSTDKFRTPAVAFNNTTTATSVTTPHYRSNNISTIPSGKDKFNANFNVDGLNKATFGVIYASKLDQKHTNIDFKYQTKTIDSAKKIGQPFPAKYPINTPSYNKPPGGQASFNYKYQPKAVYDTNKKEKNIKPYAFQSIPTTSTIQLYSKKADPIFDRKTEGTLRNQTISPVTKTETSSLTGGSASNYKGTYQYRATTSTGNFQKNEPVSNFKAIQQKINKQIEQILKGQGQSSSALPASSGPFKDAPRFSYQDPTRTEPKVKSSQKSLSSQEKVRQSPSKLNQELQKLREQTSNSSIKSTTPKAKEDKYRPIFKSVTEQSAEGDDQDHNNTYEYVVEQYDVGSRYEGYKLNGKREGKGKFFYKEGSYYDGEWKQNKMHGKGILYYANGRIAYDGEWVMDQFSGTGKVYNDERGNLKTPFDYTDFYKLEDNWEFYEGQLYCDARHGNGKIKLVNGQIFTGVFDKDKVNGDGKFYTLTGQIVNGRWNDNKLVTRYD